jgi:hypothetical protein
MQNIDPDLFIYVAIGATFLQALFFYVLLLGRERKLKESILAENEMDADLVRRNNYDVEE